MDVTFIGDEFYSKSGTMMSSVYQRVDGGLKRTDWGFIQIALSDGIEVHIYPATPIEMVWAYKELEKWRK
jgi:hypothetical protein